VTLSESRVSKGFLTVVPKRIRRAAEIAEGDVLEWEIADAQVVVRKRKRRTIADITGLIAYGGDAVESKCKVQGIRSSVR
jgi:bifunctional DNA-binding transcriptional regulator/antitoxin component of YhaV-PrlF toxin-antitoxin module